MHSVAIEGLEATPKKNLDVESNGSIGEASSK